MLRGLEDSPGLSRWTSMLVVGLSAAVLLPAPVRGQETSEPTAEAAETSPDSTEEAPEPTTVDNPTIPTDQLELLVRPLTMEELEVEAAGWLDLVKEKVNEISQAELQVKRSNENVAEIEESAGSFDRVWTVLQCS